MSDFDNDEDIDFDDGSDEVLEEFIGAIDTIMDFVDGPQQSPAPFDEDSPEVVKRKRDQNSESHTQWAIGGNNRFSPVGSTVKSVPAGIYSLWSAPGQWGLELQKVSSDEIYLLPDMATDKVLKEVYKFWESEAKYRAHNLLYKRGIILYGAPGSGKTVAVKLLMNELVRRGGIVMIVSHVGLAIEALKAIRRIEPTRHIICVFEDIDEIIYTQGEANVLSMLDGEANIDNILNLATTNYPEKLGARIINRPSRFDRRMHVPMPSDEARKAYLQKATRDGVPEEDLVKWVLDTKDMSIAHLRELVAAVHCLEQPYDEVIDRLKDMAKQVETDTGFGAKRKISFGNATSASGSGGW